MSVETIAAIAIVGLCLFIIGGALISHAEDQEVADAVGSAEVVDTHAVIVRCHDCKHPIQIAYGVTRPDGTQGITLRSIVQTVTMHRLTECARVLR